ncbi:MAG: hypothetical protein MJE68_26640 [Proteobacteria bacterium]|nr:hypothetical protein [Pseudomonadota bacterium]
MEKAVVEAEEAELSDDTLSNSDEDENADVLQVLSRKPQLAVVVEPASRQTRVNWVAPAWKKLDERPPLVPKSVLRPRKLTYRKYFNQRLLDVDGC